MTKTMPPLTALALLFACGLHAAPAQAQLSRTFVSAATGNDANNCDRPTPCRSFQGAHDKTNPDGEITVLDPGGYGAVMITKSISIVNDGGGEASILVSGGATGITVNAGPAAYVNLRGITVQGIGFGGGTGLKFNGGFALTIGNCVFRNLTGDGITILPIGNGTSNVSIFDTLVADNGGWGISILAFANNVAIKVDVDSMRLVNNNNDGLAVTGSSATGTMDVTVTNSVAAGNRRAGFTASSVNGKATTSLALIRSVAANNDSGVNADGGQPARLRVGQSAITGNAKTWRLGGGAVLQSFGDNYVAGNADGDPALPLIAKK
jgi:hypothetical protein